jgi:hypothetical protein
VQKEINKIRTYLAWCLGFSEELENKFGFNHSMPNAHLRCTTVALARAGVAPVCSADLVNTQIGNDIHDGMLDKNKICCPSYCAASLIKDGHPTPLPDGIPCKAATTREEYICAGIVYLRYPEFLTCTCLCASDEQCHSEHIV